MIDTWQHYFQPGETVLWEGAPKPGVYGWPGIIGLTVFGLPFMVAGIGIFIAGIWQIAEAKVWGDAGLGLFFGVFGVPFAGAGAAMVLGLLWAAAQAHRRVRYALSTRCAYVAKSWWRYSLESYPILPGTAFGLEKGRSAYTVWFHALSEKDTDGDRTTTRVSFDNIAGGDEVYRLLRSIQTGQA